MAKNLHDLLIDSPTNWERWGSSDEIGALNFLNSDEVLRGLQTVKKGKVFCLGTKIGDPRGEPKSTTRSHSTRLNVRDKGTYGSGKVQSGFGGFESADDLMTISLQGTTHVDALGHPWYDDMLWNGYDARTTIGALEKCSVEPIAEHGIVGHAVLLDLARWKKTRSLSRNYVITLDDLLECASSQSTSVLEHDILVLRTGWLGLFYKDPKLWFGYDSYDEPGLTYDPDLIKWFHEMEIPMLASDTVANEKMFHPSTGILLPLHASLVRNLGILFNELIWLDELGADCESDGQWEFLYIASPLKIVGATASPINPIGMK